MTFGRALSAVVAAAAVAAGCSSDESSSKSSQPAPLISAPDVCETALACESFDALPVDAAPSGVWSATQNLGSVRVDATRAYSGTQSVKATTVATEVAYKAALLGYRDPSVLPTSDNAHFGRVMFFLESAPEVTVHWTFLAGAGRSAPQEGYPTGYDVLYRYGGQKPVAGGSQLMASYETPGFYSTPPTGPDTDCHQDSAAVPMPVGRWACAEWRFDGATSEMQLWIDGTEVEGLHVIRNGTRCRTLPSDAPWIPPVFSRIDLGWESYQADVERAIWVDDFVLDARRIGCPPAP
jgi:polysaccharide lyase-like protein